MLNGSNHHHVGSILRYHVKGYRIQAQPKHVETLALRGVMGHFKRLGHDPLPYASPSGFGPEQMWLDVDVDHSIRCLYESIARLPHYLLPSGTSSLQRFAIFDLLSMIWGLSIAEGTCQK